MYSFHVFKGSVDVIKWSLRKSKDHYGSGIAASEDDIQMMILK